MISGTKRCDPCISQSKKDNILQNYQKFINVYASNIYNRQSSFVLLWPLIMDQFNFITLTEWLHKKAVFLLNVPFVVFWLNVHSKLKQRTPPNSKNLSINNDHRFQVPFCTFIMWMSFEQWPPVNSGHFFVWMHFFPFH